MTSNEGAMRVQTVPVLVAPADEAALMYWEREK